MIVSLPLHDLTKTITKRMITRIKMITKRTGIMAAVTPRSSSRMIPPAKRDMLNMIIPYISWNIATPLKLPSAAVFNCSGLELRRHFRRRCALTTSDWLLRATREI